MSFKTVTIGSQAPEIIKVVVEIPKGSNNKYEYDEEIDEIKLDRILHSPLFYPVDYGFIPKTKSLDGDHLDAMIVTQHSTFPGCIMEVRPIALLKMTDEQGIDDKILAVPTGHPYYEKVKKLEDLTEHHPKEIIHFFKEYKHLENKQVEVKGWRSREEALKIIKQAHHRFKSQQ